CSSRTFCVAVDDSGRVFVSTDPAGGASTWIEHGSVASGRQIALSCVSTVLCVDITEQEGTTSIYATSDPATDEQWPTTQLAHEQAVNSVACPGVDLCVAVDSRGNAFVSSDPGSAQPTWTASSIDREDLTAISCPSELLCVAVDR